MRVTSSRRGWRRCRSVSDSHCTSVNPAAFMRRASAISSGKLATDLGRYAYAVAVAADHAADEWQHAMEVQVVPGADEPRSRRRELEDHEPRTGLQHAMHFAQSRVEIGDVADAERHDRAVHRRVARAAAAAHRPSPARAAAGGALPAPARSIGSAKSAPMTRPLNPGVATSAAPTSSVPAQTSRYVPDGARSHPSRRSARRRHRLSTLKLSRWLSRS